MMRYTLLIDSGSACFTSMKSVAWYHWDRSGFVLLVMRLLYDWCVCGGGSGVSFVRLTSHMTTDTSQWTSKNSFLCLTTFMSLAVKVDVHPS